MSSAAVAALASWRFDPLLTVALLLSALIYFRGWLRLHREMPARFGPGRLTSFLLGECGLLLAIASPLDTFASFLLSVHMIQHLLLIAVVPPLLLIGQPVLPMLRGLPRRFLKEALGPFLAAPELRWLGNAITRPLVCWIAGAASTVVWHFPRLYELGLQSQSWHRFEHTCFLFGSLLFWWPVIEVWPAKRHTSRWLMLPYLLLADTVNSLLSAYLVFSSNVVYPSYAAAPRLWGSSALDDQATAGALMWVPGSFIYLLAAAIITFQALHEPAGVRPSDVAKRANPPRRLKPAVAWDLLRVPVIGAMLRSRYFRRVVQIAMLGLAALVMLDGFRGPQVSPLNLAGVLPWTHWRGLAVVALLVAGNLVCFSCPFTLPRDVVRRFVSPRLRWPSPLRSKWIPVALLALFFWSYEAFSLWDSPWWTAWIIAGYFVTATLVDTLFQGASFCKYVCPIGQFQFVNSLISPLEVSVRSTKVCDSCHTHDCLRGNAGNRGCELDLFQPTKAGNFDCTFCLDCVKACPNDNVGIAAFVPAHTLIQSRLANRGDVAALALLVVLGAFLSAAAMTAPVMGWNDGSGLRVGLYFALGLLVIPSALVFGNAQRLRFLLALVPLGASMWMAHYGYHLLTAGSSLLPAAARFFGIEMAMHGAMGQLPDWWRPVEILLLDCGLLVTLYVQWRGAARKVLSFAPWALLAVGLYAAGLWILAQPMQMRGMVMN
jgi:cytochrome c oxidase assembly factor CtaG